MQKRIHENGTVGLGVCKFAHLLLSNSLLRILGCIFYIKGKEGLNLCEEVSLSLPPALRPNPKLGPHNTGSPAEEARGAGFWETGRCQGSKSKDTACSWSALA
jgi:hypothetical protein